MKKITLNPDAEVVKTVKEGLKRTGGYCPCRLERTEENKCMCKEFRDQINDPEDVYKRQVLKCERHHCRSMY